MIYGEAIYIGTEEPAARIPSLECPYPADTLLCFPAAPDYRPGHSVIIFPGGGYNMLAWEHEGVRMAQWLAAHGISAFVGIYPVKEASRFPGVLESARRAVRWVRDNAEKWGGAADKVGVLGFSAGGHLAAMTAVGFAGNPAMGMSADPLSRPDFAALVYARTIFEGIPADRDSRRNLLGTGTDNTDEMAQAISIPNMLTADAPPFFLVHSNEDKAVPAEDSLLLAMALRQKNIPVELHLYKKGAHGIGLHHNHPWGNAVVEWILHS